MVDPDFQYVIAELAMALAGFSGVVVGVKSSSQKSVDRQDRFGLLLILLTSGCAMLFSLAPLALQASGMSAQNAGDLSNTLVSLVVLGACSVVGIASFKSSPRYPFTFWPLLIFGWVLAIALLVKSAGLIEYAADLSALMLLFLLTAGFAQFFSFLIMSWWKPEQ